MSEHASNVFPVPGALSLDLESEFSQSRQHKSWQAGLFSKLLFKTDDLRLVLISLEPGARMKEHHADGTTSIHCLQGTLCVHVQGQVSTPGRSLPFWQGSSMMWRPATPPHFC